MGAIKLSFASDLIHDIETFIVRTAIAHLQPVRGLLQSPVMEPIASRIMSTTADGAVTLGVWSTACVFIFAFIRPAMYRCVSGTIMRSSSATRNQLGTSLYGVFFVKELARAAKLSFVGFLVRSQSPFLRPDLRIADVDARKICTRLAVTPTLRHASPLPGHTMTASSTTAR
jgi:hypothetical protein